MATPTVRRINKANRSQEPGGAKSLSLTTRRFAAWAAEMALVVTSGLVPFGIGAYINAKTELHRVPLNPVLVATERAIARPLALPVSFGTRNVAWPTNFLWTVALLAPMTLSGWQIFLLAKTGSTIPKRWMGIRVVTPQGTPPGLVRVLVREAIGRWTVPMTVAYVLWRYTFLFPHLSIFTALASLALVGEAMGLPWQQKRRALHDFFADTYTIDANRPFAVPQGRGMRSQSVQWTEEEEQAAIPSIVIPPDSSDVPSLWKRMRRNPSLTLFLVASLSMAAVLTTLVGTQIYIQTQANAREQRQIGSQQFATLIKKLDPASNAPIEEKQRAIMAMGTLNYPEALQFLTGLLDRETDPVLVQTIQDALVTKSIGTKALPDLKNRNLSLANELDSARSSSGSREALQMRLQANQRAINKIMAVYTGKLDGTDLSRIRLDQSASGQNSSFSLVLDKTDLSGVNFKRANLNQASFANSRFRNVGKDGRWDTFDDSVADFSFAQAKQSNFTGANLSRIVMSRADLSRSNFNKASLLNARLVGTNLSSAQLVSADLRGAVLENASLTGSDLSEAKLNEADLFQARLGRAIAIGTELSYASLRKTDWQGADLTSAYLKSADLSDSNFSAARLTAAYLQNANLQRANLRNADLTLADLRGANLVGADFQGTILSYGKQDPADQYVQTPNVGAQSAVVKGVDFSQVKNLDTKQMAYICTQGGIHPQCP